MYLLIYIYDWLVKVSHVYICIYVNNYLYLVYIIVFFNLYYFFIYCFCTEQPQNYPPPPHTHRLPLPPSLPLSLSLSLSLSPAVADLSLLVKCNVVKLWHVKAPYPPCCFPVSHHRNLIWVSWFDSPFGRARFLMDDISYQTLSDSILLRLIVTLDIFIVTGVTYY